MRKGLLLQSGTIVPSVPDVSPRNGLRMRRCLQRLRVCASVSDVIDRRTNLSALAQTLGYASHSHFDAAFRNELRVTPAELRRIAALPRLMEMQIAISL